MQQSDSLYTQGLNALEGGLAVEAIQFLERALAHDNSRVDIHYALASALRIAGRFHDSLLSLDYGLSIDPRHPELFNLKALVLQDLGMVEDAVQCAETAVHLNPNSIGPQNNLGVLYHQLGRLHDAATCYRHLITLQPNSAVAHYNLGRVHQSLAEFSEAATCFQMAIEHDAGLSQAYLELGNAFIKLGDLKNALVAFEGAISVQPDFAQAYNNFGNLHRELGRPIEAIAAYCSAIDRNPEYAEAFNNRGNVYRDLGELVKAETDYLHAVKLKPTLAEAFSNLGCVYSDTRNYQAALDCFNRALSLRGDFATAFNNRGNVFRSLHRFDTALDDFDEALKLVPNYGEALHNRGSVLWEMGKLEEALSAFFAALTGDTPGFCALGSALHLSCSLNSWTTLSALRDAVTVSVIDAQCRSTPFALLGCLDDPQIQKQHAYTWVRAKVISKSGVSESQGLGRLAKGCRIHVGYVSGDFHDHATSHLIAQMLEMHDKSRFELTAISLGPERNDAVRKRVSAAFDRFIDVRFQSDRAVAERCRELGIDIAIDLKGYTQDSRPGIFAERCAPIQVSYLGYPGTMGASFIDYIVADSIVIPPDDVQYYSEKVIWLPHSYQANDRKRVIASTVYQRQALGLPEKGFIFCCFNNSYKIQPETFDVWMRILQQVSGSVLWLLAIHPVASENLRKEAIARGVDPNRLIFAQRMKLPEHLARHRVADLFIDTWPYNAHTTASDALWAGLPVLTLAGRSFASRVGASLLNAVGLPELVTHRVEDYESLAIALANDSGRLAGIRHKLELNRLREPLFDCARFTRHLESAYEQIVQRYRDGLAPDHLRVNEVHVIQSEATPSEPIPSVDERVSINCEGNTLEAMLGLQTRIEVMDVGAALINERPFYSRWLERGIAHLHAFEGDQRQIDLIKQTHQERASVHEAFLFDGTAQTVFVASQASGMTSLLRPRKEALRFFNGFEAFGQVLEQRSIQTQRLDEIQGVPQIDFLKMDVQGAELTILKHGTRVLGDCVAIQLEVSYVPLYEGQPSFGDVDVWLRQAGFVPHCFVEIKRWSIAPAVRNNDIRAPFNQLLESDIVYIRDPLKVERWDAESVKKLILLAHEALGSIDLAVYLMRELERRDPSLAALQQQYLLLVNKR